MLGYKALCSFSPFSAIILLGLGGLHIFLHKKNAAKKPIKKLRNVGHQKSSVLYNTHDDNGGKNVPNANS